MRMGLAQPSGAATTRTDDGAPQRVTAGPSLFAFQVNFPILPTNRQPRTKTPLICPCEPLCAILLTRRSVWCIAFGGESECEAFVTYCAKSIE